MIRPGQAVFVDTGAWIALALAQDAYHERAKEGWEAIQRAAARPCTSLPVAIETFTWLDRKVDRRLARSWSEGLRARRQVEVIECTPRDLLEAWPWLDKREFHKLSLVDALSFVMLRRRRIRQVLAFDTHFAQAGFRTIA